VTAPQLTPAHVAARWLAGQVADGLAEVDGGASLAGVRPLDDGSALSLDGQAVHAADLAGGALLVGRVLVKELAARTGRSPLQVALDLGACLDRLDPQAAP